MTRDSAETVFKALSHGRRRRILTYLAERNETASLDGLTEHLAIEGQEDPDNVRISLNHVHLPKLDELNVLNYDRGAETVRRRRLAVQATTVLETTRTVINSKESTE
jgi:DNA-binding transcriptional ArsR family regulator